MKMANIKVGEYYALSETNDVYSDPNVRFVEVLEKDVVIQVRNAGVNVRYVDTNTVETVHSRQLKCTRKEYNDWQRSLDTQEKEIQIRIRQVQRVLDGLPFSAAAISNGDNAGDVSVLINSNDFFQILLKLKEYNEVIKTLMSEVTDNATA